MELGLLAGYVNDVRQGGTGIRFGLRFEIEERKWKWSEESWKEDRERTKDGENNNERMKRLCMPLMNSINRDLTFTAETPDEYENGKLPTLDFELWVRKDGELDHNYFQRQ